MGKPFVKDCIQADLRSRRTFLFGCSVALIICSLGFTPKCVAQTEGNVRLDWSGISTAANDLRVKFIEGQLSLETIGHDAFFWFDLPAIENAKRDWVLAFDYFCAEGAGGLEWQRGRPARPNRFLSMPNLEPAEGWSTYTANISQIDPSAFGRGEPSPIRIDLGRRVGVRLQIRNVRLRPISDRELEGLRQAEQVRQWKLDLAKQIRDVRTNVWPAQIDEVRFGSDELVIKGQVSPALAKDSFAIIRRSDVGVAALPPDDSELVMSWPARVNPETSAWTATVAESTSIASLAGSRWQLVRISESELEQNRKDRFEAVSAIRYSGPHPVKTSPPRPAKLQAAKGLTCITSRYAANDLRGLGLQHASVNVVLNGLVQRPGGQLPRGYRDATIDGKPVWVNEARLNQLDRNVRVCVDAGAQVAGILLILNSQSSKDGIVHQEADPAGTYAMPDLSRSESQELYRLTLQVLAERYSGLNPEHGRIEHWIVHNEVDYGWQWTNMGKQPFEIFMDHYVRSMRLVDAAVRSRNPHARVFISLTHRWNVPDERPWKTYAPRDMLRWLNDDSKRHGDFGWGVAYHPYPQSLWKADTWNDQEVDRTLDTKLITMKNLEVLDRFMHQTETRNSGGEVRPVICSEQGFHADPNDANQVRTQAAALLYTFDKLRQCPSVLAFDYHRPNDHPREGGLLLGLRGFPTKENPQGVPKPAWDVYRAIHTADEEAFREKFASEWEATSSGMAR